MKRIQKLLFPPEASPPPAEKGKTGYITQRTIKYQLYAPYSPDLHSFDLVKSGQDYTDAVIIKAFSDLRVAGVKSRAISGMLVADVFASHSEFLDGFHFLNRQILLNFKLIPRIPLNEPKLSLAPIKGKLLA